MTNKMDRQDLNERENSWYIKIGSTHNFLCRCGQTDQYTDAMLLDIHHPNHYCSNCGNTHYLDSVMFLNNPKVIRWSIFNWKIEKIKTEKAWIVKAYVSIPQFDYTMQKIQLRKTVIATNTLLFTCKHEYTEIDPPIMKKYVYNHLDKATLIKELIDKELERELYHFVLGTPIDVISWIEEEQLLKLSITERITLLSFFLEYDHLKEYDFFYWDNFVIFKNISKEYPSVKKMLFYISNHRKEKSIKKAYFESYIESMEIFSTYNFTTDFVFARHIADRNFLLKLIKINSKIKHNLFDEIPIVTIEFFLEFLKDHYTQRSITNLFTDSSALGYGNVVRDTLQMFIGEQQENNIREYFRKVPLTFQRLHNEFIRINRLGNVSAQEKIVFEYHDNDIKAQKKGKTFEYRLPKTVHVLQKWSQQLHNCMHGYSRAVHQGKSIIYGVFKDEILTYAVEIKGNKIVQALGKHNRRMEVHDRAEIDEWYKEIYVATWIGATSVNRSA